jgi:hypothetical protein
VEFYFGYKYLGVWKEWVKLTEFSSGYMPLLGAFAVAACAALSEETIFRLFGITWARAFFKNTAVAILLTSFIWGLGHAGYAVFPAWFRVFEIMGLGVLYGIFFLRYGIIPLLTAHYVFDIFWTTSAHLFGRSCTYLFWGSLAMMILPLIFAAIAYIINRPEKERDTRRMLSKAQEYNLGILEAFVASRKAEGVDAGALKSALMAYGWDPVLVDLALSRIYKE